ncbi:MAG TPA: hypothetical protein VGC99_16505 [Candidatus Tectomicrobia bacterium]
MPCRGLLIAPEPAARPQPVGNELRATLAGKAAGITPLAPLVAMRDGPHRQHHWLLYKSRNP